MGRKRGREFMNPVVMLASYVTASNCPSTAPPHGTFSLLFRRRRRKRLGSWQKLWGLPPWIEK